MKVSILDGGPNDEDGKLNGSVSDPGAVVVPKAYYLPPVTKADTVTLRGQQSTALDVLSNDNSGDGSVLTLMTVSSVAGALVEIANNQVMYTPSQVPVSDDKLVYTVVNDAGFFASETVNIQWIENQKPRTQLDTISMARCQIETLDVLSNDSDPDGDSLTLVSAQSGEEQLMIENNRIALAAADVTHDYLSITYDVTDGYTQVSEVAIVMFNDRGCQLPTPPPDEIPDEKIELKFGGNMPLCLLWLMLVNIALRYFVSAKCRRHFAK